MAGALAEVEVLEAAAILEDGESRSWMNIQVASHDTTRCTCDYLQNHFSLFGSIWSLPEMATNATVTTTAP